MFVGVILWETRRSEQFRAIGFSGDSLGGLQPRGIRLCRQISKTRPTADDIADKASRGEDVSAYFTNKFTVVRPVKRVNVDLTQGMMRELDARAARLNISRQAVIKTLLRRALDLPY